MMEKVTLESLNETLESLARMVAAGFSESRKENLEEIAKLRKELHEDLLQLEEKMDKGFASIDKRLEEHYQSQLNAHAIRIKNLETFTGIEVAK